MILLEAMQTQQVEAHHIVVEDSRPVADSHPVAEDNLAAAEGSLAAVHREVLYGSVCSPKPEDSFIPPAP